MRPESTPNPTRRVQFEKAIQGHASRRPWWRVGVTIRAKLWCFQGTSLSNIQPRAEALGYDLWPLRGRKPALGPGSFSNAKGFKTHRTSGRSSLRLRVFGRLRLGVIPHKRHYIGRFVDRFGQRFTSSMTGLGIDPDQDWVVTSLSRL